MLSCSVVKCFVYACFCITPGGRIRSCGVQLERVERLGQEAWQGVAQVDRGGETENWGCAARPMFSAFLPRSNAFCPDHTVHYRNSKVFAKGSPWQQATCRLHGVKSCVGTRGLSHPVARDLGRRSGGV